MSKEVKEVSCIFCNIGKARYWFSKASIANKVGYPIYTCDKCKGGFVFPIPTSEYLSSYYASSTNSMEANLSTGDIDRQYEQVLGDEKDYPNSTVDSIRIASNLKKSCLGSMVLDIGGGYGFFSRELIKLGFKVDSIELNKSARKVYRCMNGFEPQNVSFDVNFAANNLGKYDAILLSQVLEHLPIDQDPIQNIHKILKPGGICVIAVPHFRSLISLMQGKKDMFIVPPEHINFFTIKSLIELFYKYGFKVIKLETISRYDFNKKKQILGVFFLPFKLFFKTFFYISDYFACGMFINLYLKKMDEADLS
jgi:2-polyprenyl-3-methyl-5-hydroxy-6-metoxy-1,4-benzoquinol methylase